MAGTMEDLMREAFAKEGKQLPEVQKPSQKASKVSSKNRSKKKRKDSKAGLRAKQKTSSSVNKSTQKSASSTGRSTSEGLDISCYNASQKNKTNDARKELKIRLKKDSRVIKPEYHLSEKVALSDFLELGNSSQCCPEGHEKDEREVVIGLDFGTSSVKAVVGDAGLGRAFAVPFFDDDGINSYLLPSRLYENNEGYALFGQDPKYRDLKLSFLSNPAARKCQIPVVGFICLILRHIRGWLFESQNEIYSDCKILWTLSVGLPAEYHLEDELHDSFEHLVHLAWVASLKKEKINFQSISNLVESSDLELDKCGLFGEADECEVRIIPEIAAQIHGYVNSSKFNDRDRNFYLLVDVGAGSVDSSLFHVKKERGKKWSFDFYTSVVAPNGVMNLHRERLRWWLDNLRQKADAKELLKALEDIKFPTDWVGALPEKFDGYIEPIELDYEDVDDPDMQFFHNRLCRQVISESYVRAKVENLLGIHDLENIPTFFCGGGMQLSFYQKLKEKMKSHPNYSWIRAKPRQIELPNDMEAPGINRDDYHRLSVAYGLSFLNVKNVKQMKPMMSTLEWVDYSWRDNYVDKDMC